DVIGEPFDGVVIAAAAEKLERANANVAAGNTREHATGQEGIARDAFAAGDGGEAARGRHTEHGHRFADDVFAQHRAQRREAIAIARVRRLSTALELNVVTPAITADHFAQQDGAAIAELRIPAAELMAGVGGRNRLRTGGNLIAGKYLHSLWRFKPGRIDIQ